MNCRWLFRRSCLRPRSLASLFHEYIICENMGISKSKRERKTVFTALLRLPFSLQSLWFDNKKPAGAFAACATPQIQNGNIFLSCVGQGNGPHGFATHFRLVKSRPKIKNQGSRRAPWCNDISFFSIAEHFLFPSLLVVKKGFRTKVQLAAIPAHGNLLSGTLTLSIKLQRLRACAISDASNFGEYIPSSTLNTAIHPSFFVTNRKWIPLIILRS